MKRTLAMLVAASSIATIGGEASAENTVVESRERLETRWEQARSGNQRYAVPEFVAVALGLKDRDVQRAETSDRELSGSKNSK